MVLFFHMKQILILIRTVFVELMYLSGDLKTIWKLSRWCYLRSGVGVSARRFVPSVSAIICRPDFPCFSQRTPPHFYSIAWVFLSVRTVDQQQRRIGSVMNRFYTKQTKIFADQNSWHTPCTFIVLHGDFCLGKTSGPTTKAADSKVLR